MRSKILCLVLLSGLTINAATVNLHGVVSNTSGGKISNAVVTLVKEGLKDTTGTDGSYTLISGTATVYSPVISSLEEITMNNGVLEINLSNPSTVKIDIYDTKGTLLKQGKTQHASNGIYRMTIADKTLNAKMLVVNATIGSRSVVFRYLAINNGKASINQAITGTKVSGSKLAHVAAVNDTLKVTATNYTTKNLAIKSYDTTINITLDSAGASAKSAGCGKTFSTLTSGTYNITSAGLSRSYIIKIPSGYKQDTAYRLIFCMHCYGASASIIASTSSRSDGAYNYYGMGTYATNAILVAPQGESSGMWSQGEKDHTFFSDMLRLFKDTLCVDTTRVFSCGFSFGAMFTYSLSLAFQNQLRAVACFAPANWNIYLPTNKHLPLAYYQTTGTDDGTCWWINSTANREGGKYCLIDRLVDNGCASDTLNIPLATTSGAHVSTNFCSGKYPVKFGSFKGGHTASDTENGVNWIQKEAWDFFKQF